MSHRMGLTVVEVLVALVLIAVAFMVLASTQITSIRVTRDSNQASIATQVGNTAMERASYAFLSNRWTCDDGTFACTGTYSDVTVEGTGYAANYAIAVPADASDANLAGVALVTVTVSDPAEVAMSQYVSCMDVVPAPSYEDPSPCPEPPEPSP